MLDSLKLNLQVKKHQSHLLPLLLWSTNAKVTNQIAVFKLIAKS